MMSVFAHSLKIKLFLVILLIILQDVFHLLLHKFCTFLIPCTLETKEPEPQAEPQPETEQDKVKSPEPQQEAEEKKGLLGDGGVNIAN